MHYAKAFGAVAAVGTVGYLLLKVLLIAAAPLFGMMLSFVGTALKIGFFVALAFFVYWMFRRRREEIAV